MVNALGYRSATGAEASVSEITSHACKVDSSGPGAMIASHDGGMLEQYDFPTNLFYGHTDNVE